MPYIKMEDRYKFDPYIREISDHVNSVGELCFCIYAILQIIF